MLNNHLRIAFISIAILFVFNLGQAFGQSAGHPPAEADAKSRLAASPRHGEWAVVDAGGGDKLDVWVSYPERSDRAPVVLVVHEIFGLTDWIRSVADQLAAEGFIAVAPDFLSGKGPDGKGTSSVDADGARALIGKLERDEIVRRLNASVAYATSLPAARKQYAVLGFCWGGGISFMYATEQPNLGAAVVYYGTSPATETLQRIKAPVLGQYGGNDARVNATIPPAQAEMNRLGKKYEPELFEGAGHAFLRVQDGQSGANLKATQKAWPRTVQFLKTSLGDAVSLDTGSATTVAAAALDVDCVCDEDAAAFVAEAVW